MNLPFYVGVSFLAMPVYTFYVTDFHVMWLYNVDWDICLDLISSKSQLASRTDIL